MLKAAREGVAACCFHSRSSALCGELTLRTPQPTEQDEHHKLIRTKVHAWKTATVTLPPSRTPAAEAAALRVKNWGREGNLGPLLLLNTSMRKFRAISPCDPYGRNMTLAISF